MLEWKSSVQFKFCFLGVEVVLPARNPLAQNSKSNNQLSCQCVGEEGSFSFLSFPPKFVQTDKKYQKKNWLEPDSFPDVDQLPFNGLGTRIPSASCAAAQLLLIVNTRRFFVYFKKDRKVSVGR